MTDKNETQIFKLNKDNANDFVARCTNSDAQEHDLTDLTDIDCAGLQALLALAQSGHSFTNIPNEIAEKLKLTGATTYIKH